MKPRRESDIIAVPQPYDVVRTLVAALSVGDSGPAALAAAAGRLGLAGPQLDAMLTAWGGLDAGRFARAASPAYARSLLRDDDLLARPGNGIAVPVTVVESRTPAPGEALAMQVTVRPSPFGDVIVLTRRSAIAALGFLDGDDLAGELADMRRRWPSLEIEPGTDADVAFVDRIFRPQEWRAPFPLALLGTAFDRAIWHAMLPIPIGEVTTYSDLAGSVGRPTAARAVGAAVGRNPVSFLVPCHRVVGRDGALTGYYWGTGRKQTMLAWEAGLAGRV